MSSALKLIAVEPSYAIPGGEIVVTCEGFRYEDPPPGGCFVGGSRCRIVAASSRRILAIVPEDEPGAALVATAKIDVHLESLGGGEQCGQADSRAQINRRYAYRCQSGG